MTLTLARIVAGPVIAGLILWGASETYLDPPLAGLIFVCAGALFALAALTDWLDGHLARSMNAVTPLGAALDHCADKVLITCTLVALAFQSLPLNIIIAAILLLGRDLFVAGLREGLSASGRSLPVSGLGKWKAAAAMLGVGALIFEQAAYLDRAPDPVYLAAAWTARAGIWAAVALALVSAWDYVAAALRPAETPASVEAAEIDRV